MLLFTFNFAQPSTSRFRLVQVLRDCSYLVVKEGRCSYKENDSTWASSQSN